MRTQCSGVIYGDYCFEFQTNITSWEEAQGICKDKHGRLPHVALNDTQLRNFVNSYAQNGSHDAVWLGSTINSDKNWHWISGKLVDLYIQ